MILLAIGNIINVVAGYVLVIVLSRVVGVEGYGAYYAAAGVVGVVNVITLRGAPLEAARQIAANPSRVADALRGLARRSVRLGVVLIAAILIGAAIIAAVPGHHEFAISVAVTAAAVPGFAAMGMGQALFTGVHAHALTSAQMVAYGTIRVVTIAAGAIALGVPGAMLGFAAAPLIVALLFVTAMRRSQSRLLAGRVELEPAVVVAEPAQSGARTGWLVAIALASTLLLTIDAFVAKIVLEARDSGGYAAASTLAHVPYFLLATVANAVLPDVAAVSSRDARAAAIRRAFTETLILASAPVAILVACGPELLPMIFGDAFTVPASLVWALLAATLAAIGFLAMSAIDIATGRAKRAGVVGLSGVVVLLAAVAAAGTTADMVTLGIATACAVGAIQVCYIVVLRREWGPLLDTSVAAQGVGLAIIVGVLVAVTPAGVATIAAAIIGGCVWLAIALLRGWVDIARTAPSSH